jgi:hypothetical protein
MPFRAASVASPILVVAAAASCSSGSPKGMSLGSSPVSLAPDHTSFQAAWKPDTIVVDQATVQSKLTNPTAGNGVYRFEPSLAQVASALPGQTLVLTGVDLVKIDSVVVQPDAIVVTTEPASLLDAATDANVSWDIGVDMSQPLRTQSFAPHLRLASDPATVCEATADAGPCIPTTTYKGMLGSLQATQSLAHNPDGSLKMTTSLEFPLQAGSPAVLSVVGTALLHSFREQGSIIVQASSLTSASVALRDVDLDLDLDVGAVALGTNGKSDRFEFPIEMTFPFTLGPLPAYFKLGMSIELNSTLTSTSSARSHVHFHVGGSGELQSDGTSLNGTGTLDSVDGMPPTVMDTETVSTATAGFGVVLNWPKVSFGVGLAEVAAGEAYLTGKEEVVINETINLNNHGLIAGNCTIVSANNGLFVGGTIRLAGLTFKLEKQIFGMDREVFKGGNPTIAECH